jgi:uncharacterized protein YkwD
VRLDRTERKVIRLINSYRARHGRARLHASRSLAKAADRHSRDMIAHGFFAHSSANGTAAAARVRSFTSASSMGENIAFIPAGSGNRARTVVSLWIGSAGHRQVLLGRSFRRIGVAGRSGRLGGQAGSAFTADFASH